MMSVSHIKVFGFFYLTSLIHEAHEQKAVESNIYICDVIIYNDVVPYTN